MQINDSQTTKTNRREQTMNKKSPTHLLQCSHCIGNYRNEYTMKCLILKEMPDGKRVKLLVFGAMYWKDTDHIQKIRYVNKSRVFTRG